MGRSYDFFLRGESGRYDVDTRISLPSVTTIISAVLAKPQLVQWAYNSTIDVISTYIREFYLKKEEEDTSSEDFFDTFGDHDMLNEWIRESGIHYDDVSAQAADRGKQAHAFLETLTKLHTSVAGPEAALHHADKVLTAARDPYKVAVAAWWLYRQPRPVLAEKVVYSLLYRYAGRLDLLADLDRQPQGFSMSAQDDEPHGFRRTVIDLKTRRADLSVYTSDQVQLGGYKLALEEMGYGDDYKLDKLVLLAHDDGTYEECGVWVEDFAFLDLVSAYYRLRKRRIE